MRLLFLMTTLALLLCAEPIHWYESYTTALAEAKKTHRPLMLFLTQPGCKTCRYMEEQVFPDPKVSAYLNEHYIAARFHIQEPELPERFRVEMSPIFTFVDPASGEVLDQIIGGKKPEYFYDALEELVEWYPNFHPSGTKKGR